MVGTHWYAFNFVNGSGVTGTKNKLLCFDVLVAAACAAQSYTVDFGTGNMTTSLPAPAIAAIGTHVLIPVDIDGVNWLTCFDGASQGSCGGQWPVISGLGTGSFGAPFPMLDPAGSAMGVCLPSGADPCYDDTGLSVPTPPGMTGVITSNDQWNGPAFVLGPRAYVPNGNANAVQCYDYSTNAACANSPKTFNGLSSLYTVNADPQRPDCIWVNADVGSGQIQNFDAYTGGACGQGPIRVLASTSVVTSQTCTPSTYQTLQVTSPSRSAYTSGSVQFLDGDGNPIPGISDRLARRQRDRRSRRTEPEHEYRSPPVPSLFGWNSEDARLGLCQARVDRNR
jgi:hypothetical protein